MWTNTIWIIYRPEWEKRPCYNATPGLRATTQRCTQTVPTLHRDRETLIQAVAAPSTHPLLCTKAINNRSLSCPLNSSLFCSEMDWRAWKQLENKCATRFSELKCLRTERLNASSQGWISFKCSLGKSSSVLALPSRRQQGPRLSALPVSTPSTLYLDHT